MSKEKQIDTPTNTPTQNQFTNCELKQIEEMALELCHPRNIVKMIHHRTCGNCDTSLCDIYELCVDLYNAGYRKQSEIIDEFAERIKKEFTDYPDPVSYLEIGECRFCELVDKLSREMKGGAE